MQCFLLFCLGVDYCFGTIIKLLLDLQYCLKEHSVTEMDIAQYIFFFQFQQIIHFEGEFLTENVKIKITHF